MNQTGLDLQSAIDYVGNLCDQTLVRFNEDRKNLPSWGPDVDRQVATYVDGLASWIIGNVWWLVWFVLFLRLGDSLVHPSSNRSFQTERYPGLDPRDFKTAFWVNLLPLHRQ